MDKRFEKILTETKRIFMTYGIRSVSMDDICRELGISKKTLYLFVSNKAELVKLTLLHEHRQGAIAFKKIMKENKNAIDQLMMVSLFISKKLSEINPTFSHDLKKYFPSSSREDSEKRNQSIALKVKENIELGIKQNLYRKDLNSELVSQLYVQKIETIMSPENFLASNYSFTEIFKVMFENHIRGIANEEGIKHFEEKIKTFNIKL
ncbi:MAG: TetR/AcrR family transcriptional regulator [Bacteroidetes bacterium]|jgi:AcrR family transcriptional regulator|nr:TetR/AcrR family transcriptional regulator [Bacteroidota bacterium]MBT5531210.1 TetR/AcrR family transcriptional regulator [Cytophagia bacterium]MBT3423241.1 TetR/AcrR family transcriptional regulator [Bacteroidota bacterium]MBT3800214.1 TetR/AcrR family transcriptional regulator [Bacteroidota bacterium]MBT3934313.1 TetR/AcrR family transcriptional regulator [Bacteroidota bacterium]